MLLKVTLFWDTWYLKFFCQVFKENAAKELYMFATVAIDPKNIENVFSSVRNIIFTQAAEDLNLH